MIKEWVQNIFDGIMNLFGMADIEIYTDHEGRSLTIWIIPSSGISQKL